MRSFDELIQDLESTADGHKRDRSVYTASLMNESAEAIKLLIKKLKDAGIEIYEQEN